MSVPCPNVNGDGRTFVVQLLVKLGFVGPRIQVHVCNVLRVSPIEVDGRSLYQGGVSVLARWIPYE